MAHQLMRIGLAIAEVLGFTILPACVQPADYTTYPLPPGEDLD